MLKQKRPKKANTHLQLLQRRRTAWFAVLFAGLLAIQFAYNVHAGQPKIMGYSANVVQEQLLENTNRHRSQHDLPELHIHADLSVAAQAKAEDMVKQNYWNHLAPDGTTPWEFIKQSGYAYRYAGENLAYGFGSSAEILTAWMGSESHKANVLGNYRDVGFGIVESSDYQGGQNTLVVAMYASPDASADAAQQSAISTQALVLTGGSKHVNGLSVIAAGEASWASYASFGLLGAAAIGFIVTHLELLKFGWYRGKHYLAVHPVFDAVVVVAIALFLVYAASGFIR